jgi:hypothetical protein
METESQREWELQNRKRLGELVEEANAVSKADMQHLKLQDGLLLEQNTDPMPCSNWTIASLAMLDLQFSKLLCSLALEAH